MKGADFMNPVVILVLVLSLALPIGLMIYLKKLTHVKLWCFIAGAICFFVFSNILEGLVHQFFLGGSTAVSVKILTSPLLYTVYACLAAGIFEETGRLFGFKVLLKNHNERECAMAYGIGHGGIEVILTLTLVYVFYLLASLGVQFADAVTTSQYAYVAQSIPLLSGLVAVLERVSAMLLHVGLSMLMFVATKKQGKLWLYPVSILIHALSDVPAALAQAGVFTSITLIEIIVFIIGIAVAILGARVLIREFPKQVPAAEAEAAPEA